MKPSRFGKYTLLDKLGRGSVADTYLALRDGASDLLVVKRLRSSRTHADELRSQDVPMPAEAALACELHHPNVAATYEVSEVDEMPYWAIEHLHGKPLDEVLAAAARSGGLPIQLGLWIAAGVLRALHYAHTWKDRAGAPQPIAHGDVHAHNVFICYSGEVRLLDFCVARRVVKRGADVADEQLFRAPEAELGLHDVRADIYSAGCLLKVLAAAHAEPDSFTWIQVEGPIRAVSERAMREDPSARHPSAEAMLREVEALLSNILAFQAPHDVPAELAAHMQQVFSVEREDAEARIALLRAAVGEPKPESETVAPSAEVDASAVEPDDSATFEASEHAEPLPIDPPPRLSQRPPPLPKTAATASFTPSNDDKGTGYALLAVLLAIMMLIATRLP